MAGYGRPKCEKCGKHWKFNWDEEIFYPQCKCKEKEKK